MKRIFLLLALMGAVLLSAAPVSADGDFYVVAGGGGVGTKITSLPYTITAPGFYYLAGHLNCPSGNGITVQTGGVTIDLMGFGLGGNPSGVGITASSNVEVRNGTLGTWDKGFSDDMNCRALNLRVENCYTGISLGYGSMVKGCTLTLQEDMIKDTTGIQCPGGVITGNTVFAIPVTGKSIGINGNGTIGGNWLLYCGTGILVVRASTITGNTIITPATGSCGIRAYSLEDQDAFLLAQNTVSGPGMHWDNQTGGDKVVKVNNAGF